jgi:hypothetical protein
MPLKWKFSSVICECRILSSEERGGKKGIVERGASMNFFIYSGSETVVCWRLASPMHGKRILDGKESGAF